MEQGSWLEQYFVRHSNPKGSLWGLKIHMQRQLDLFIVFQSRTTVFTKHIWLNFFPFTSWFVTRILYIDFYDICMTNYTMNLWLFYDTVTF